MKTSCSNAGRAVARLAGFGLVAVLALAGCATQPLVAEGPADQAVVHTQAGNQLLEQKRYDEALAEYDRAVALKAKYGPAHAGRAIALAQLGRGEDAHAALDAAKAHSDGATQEVGVGVARIRVATALKGEDWLEEAEDAFDDYESTAREAKLAVLHTWMGRAYLLAGKLDKATRTLEAGLGIDKDYPPASAALRDVNLAREALAGMPEQYLAVATEPEIDRADVAAIFVAELKLDRLLDKQGFKPDATFRAPEGRAASTIRREPFVDRATDVEGHWAKPMIDKMVAYQVMETVDGKFDPAHKITKVEMAMLLDGIITKVTGESATKGLGGDMIFSDVPPDHYGAAAVVLATSRGFIPARPDGKFGLKDPVSGAEALASVRKVRDFFQSRYNW
ncbi:MAG: S-layer homology domain-containing protein [bacterium]